VLSRTEDPELQRVATKLATEIDRLTLGDSNVLKRHWRDRILDAQRNRGATDSASSTSTTSSQHDAPSSAQLSIADRLEQIRQQRQTHGHNPRAVPRPLS
jgi:hypothetical protein